MELPLEPVFELEGDTPETYRPAAQAAQAAHRPKKMSLTPIEESDLETPSSASTASSSRPAFNFSRPRTHRTPLRDRIVEDDSINPRAQSVAHDNDYAAAPAPVVPTNSFGPSRAEVVENGGMSRDSFDEAAPPPITRDRNVAMRAMPRIDSATNSKKSSEEAIPRTWIYKPYIDSVSSRQGSVTSATTDESSTSTGDTESLASSEDTGYASSVSDFAMDGRYSWQPRTNLKTREANRQRYEAPRRLDSATANTSDDRDDAQLALHPRPRTQRSLWSKGSLEPNRKSRKERIVTTVSQPSTNSASLSAPENGPKPPIPDRIPAIVKQTSVDQISEHVNLWEGDGSSISSGEWTASEHDTSELSVEKIHKLKKKGINPALYAEMKSARKGKSKWINPLQGNTFLAF